MSDKDKLRRRKFVVAFIDPIEDEQLSKKKEKDYRKLFYETDRIKDKIKNHLEKESS